MATHEDEITALRARVAELETALSRSAPGTPPVRALWGADHLAEREELLAEVERVAGVGGWAWDMRAGTVAWSDELYRILGLARDETAATFERFIGAVHPEDRESVSTLAARAGEGDVPARADYRILRPDGSIRDVVGLAQIFRDENGAPHRMVGVALDVTERKRLETRLGHAQKLEALGRLAGGIAHDFNNFLTVILLNVASFRREPEGEDERIATAHEAATRAAELTGQLLAFARHSVRRAVAVDVNRTVEATLQLVAPLLPEVVRVTFDRHPGPAVVEADATHLSRVIVNLALNARDAMPGGGTLAITTSIAARPDHGGASFVRVDVADTGSGMSQATRARLFEPFFTTKEPGRGTGLGLATVFGIVAQSDGFLEVESAEGRGSRFSVFLPAAASAPHAGPAVDAPRGAVLLLEADTGVRTAMDALLRGAGYDVVPAATPNEAIERWEAEGDRLVALVSDVVMPGATGYELLARLRRDRPSLPALLVGGSAPTGASDPRVLSVRKPFLPDELVASLRRVLG